ncbi:MAG: D-glycero-beta-D-manno-heptose-7-phosphate kinase [Chloroflexota bacterium]|nr:D-glycero-beta-D-manno-heptose-7-phosphate kinase [Dehalococcoidia bacterium]MDW8252475.1 D-glycero-beta-D-manno-heptose-7-phosphate kinase [Chloroflexota bacterium]
MTALATLVDRFVGRRVLVVGDVMLDEYLRGTVRRISPEAPVPVVEVRERFCLAGGAGNVAMNLRALGAEVVIAGIVGADEFGRELRRLLDEAGVDCSGIVTSAERPTTIKTRIVAGAQQVVRVDREIEDDLTGADLETLAAVAVAQLRSVEAVILQDYDKGVFAPALLQRVLAAARAAGVLIAVDPKRRHFFDFVGTTLFKPNVREAAEALGWLIRSEREEDAAGRELLRRLACEQVLLTLGERGMALYLADGSAVRVPARTAREVFDVSGAGDTVISAATLALAAGGSGVEAAQLAAVAAGIKVGKLGAVPVYREEVLQALAEGDS